MTAILFESIIIMFINESGYLDLLESSYQFQSLHVDSCNHQVQFRKRRNSITITTRTDVFFDK